MKKLNKNNFHFFGSNFMEWKTSRNLQEVIQWFEKQKAPYQLWYVPYIGEGSYKIEFYAPQVEGALFLGAYEKKKRI